MKNKLVIKKGSKNAFTPNVVGGGIAIPIGNNMYYMKGRKHEQGGIDIGPNNNGLEVEGEEVVQVKPNELKVFSSVPFLRGNSPAELVLGGANPNTVFNAQERYKDINRLNDDGTKYRNGGDIQYIIDKINNSNKDFAKRLKQSNRKYIKDWEFPNRIATHKLSVGTDENGNNYIYPEVQNINDELHDFTDPKYKHNKWDGQISAEERGDTIRINTIQDGLNFTRNYKDLDIYPKFKIGGRKKAELGTEKQDNTSVTKPLIQEYFPAVGARKVYNDVKEILTRNGQIKPGNIEIVSPEFDLLTGIRGLTNMIIKDIPISKGSYYRVVGKDAIDDAKQIGIIRTPTKPKFDVQTLDRLSKDLKIPFNDIKNKTVEEIRELIRTSNLPPTKKLIRAKSNHGDVGFSKEGFFYKPNKNNYVIEGTENNSTFLQGHHGSYSGRFNKDINAGEPVVLREGENASNFTYWQNYPIIGWRNHKFKYGGGMNYIINGNVKNSLRHIRPKAKLGDWFRINDTKYNIGDTFNYKGQNYIVNDRNEAIPVSTNLSKANPDAILNAVTAAEWIKNKESFSPNIDLTNKQKSNNTKVNNVAKSVQYTPNPNLVDIPQLNVGNIATYFYTPKTDSTPRKGITTTSSSTNLVKSIPDNTSLSFAYTQPNKISLPRFTEDIYKRPSLSTLAKEIEDVDFIDIPRQSTKPSLKDKIKYRLNNIFGDFTTNDWLDLGTNTASSLISSIASGAILNNMPNVSLPTMTVTQMDALPEITVEELKELEKPATVTAAKLKTRYNINPQLAEIEDTLRRNINEIDRNTADSRVALARKQRASISSQQAKNQLEGQKENIETELINRDRLNQQQVALQNVNAYNQWTQAKAQQALANANLKLAADRANIANKLAVNQYNTTAQNAASQFNATNKIQEILYNSQLDQLKRQGRINNINNVFGNIVGTFSNILTRQEQRNALRHNIELMRTLAPDVPDEKLLPSVIQFLQR